MTLMHYIGGAETAGTSGRQQDVFNPATGAAITAVPLASAAEVGNAVAAAAAALPGWASTPPARRAQVMFNFRDLIKSNLDELATLISSQHGKTFDDAKGEIARGIEVVEFACGIPHALKGEYSPQVAGNVDSFSMRQPVGVVAGITPFNFPAMVPMWMFPMALACGNTFVLKPSERDPGAPMMLARLLSEAGLPEGCSMSCMATRKPSTRSSTIPMWPPSALSAPPPSANTSIRAAAPTASACRRCAARRTT